MSNMFSASCHYGLQAMFYIANHSTEEMNVELTEIATEQDIPKHFLSKILQLLVKHKLLVSTKGPNGGFKLARTPQDITILQIVESIDGLDIFSQCGTGFSVCNPEAPCPIHDDYKVIRDRVYQLFNTTTLENITREEQNGTSIIGVEAKPKNE